MTERLDDADTVGRCAAAVLRARAATGAELDATIAAAAADLRTLPPDLPARAMLAADLVRLLMRGEPQLRPQRLRFLDGLVEMADRRPPTEPDWPRTRAAARITALMRAAAELELTDARVALRELNEISAAFGNDPGIQALYRSARMGLGLLAGLQHNDESAVLALSADLDSLRVDAGGNAELHQMLDVLAGLSDAMKRHQVGDNAAAVELLTGAREWAERLPDGHYLRDAMAETMTAANVFWPLAGQTEPGDGSRPSDEQLAALRRLAERPGATAAERARHLITAGGAALDRSRETDLDRIDAGIVDLRRGVELTGVEDPQYPFHLSSLALALWHRTQVSGTVVELDEAAELLERARVAAGGPGHPNWAMINEMLSEVRRRRGDPTSSRRAALEGLRSYAWRVLLQPDPASARIAARDAARDAMGIATWCLVDHDPADALRALDAGRGLMLFAATEMRDPTQRLTEAGHPELARRWSAAERPSAELRQEVLAVLAREAGLLDPPDLDEIQAALHSLEADALVYLVPGESPQPGWAVIAPVDGAPRYLALPNLVIDDSLDVERYLGALARREIAPEVLPEQGDERLLDSLDALCGWAWKAAVGPLVRPYLDAGPARVPRFMLVPMGELARIPWQAARDPDGVYAVERVAISQTASARMLCGTAAAEPVPLTSAGLVVADPDTGGRAVELAAARLEAYAIYQTFYPAARYVGRRPDGSVSPSGAGSPDDVREWLRSDGIEAGAMLHLAAHGVMEVSPDAASSHLLLAGGAALTADELIGVMAGPARHPIGLVVLAACHTGRSVHGFDEAYSLGTMFLAAGARSVLSTQWGVPDQATSLLMFMFHHFLRAERRPTWDALRRAQLWMLDEARQAPRDMPARLRRTLADTDPSHVVAWAGFVHWGQ